MPSSKSVSATVIAAFLLAACAARIVNPRLRLELLRMERADQAAIERQVRVEQESTLHGVAETRAKTAKGEVFSRNMARLKEIIKAHGWPGRTLVGRDGARAAWLIAQHSDADPEFQKRCLRMLMDAAMVEQTSWRHVACLFDRIAVNRGDLQRYGTQGRCIVAGEWQPYPIKNAERVDERRADVGLEPLGDYVEQFDCAPRFAPFE
jgi:hypothetical protein